MEAIRTEKLTKIYKGTAVVDGLDLKVMEGEVYSLLGLNGAGKTTTVKMLSCIAAPSGGEAFVGGYNVRTESRCVKRIIGVSPQESAVGSNLTVRENLELICDIHGFSAEIRNEKIRELSFQLGLSDVLSKKAGKLSGGYKRRLSIAMALISEPKILFLDEPTLGLDVVVRRELWKVIRALRGRVTVILTTHYMEEAEELSDRVGIMSGGVLLAEGSADELMELTQTERLEKAFIRIVGGEGI